MRQPYGAFALGEVAQQLMDRHIAPRQAVFGEVAATWTRMLPAELALHCEIVDISGGLLKVRVDSPSYMYELQLGTSELLEELQLHCPKARLAKIKFLVA